MITPNDCKYLPVGQNSFVTLTGAAALSFKHKCKQTKFVLARRHRVRTPTRRDLTLIKAPFQEEAGVYDTEPCKYSMLTSLAFR